MNFRFPVFLLVLAIGFLSTAWGLAGARFEVYQKPDPRDAGPVLNEKSLEVHSELVFTNLISKQRIETDEWCHLIDNENEAPCFS